MRSRWLLLALVSLACKARESSPPDVPWMPPPDESFRDARPPAGPAQPYQPPAVQRFTMDDGVDVLLFERHTVPMVTWRLQYPGGSFIDPAGKEGRTELCAWLTLQRPDDTANLLADIGSSVSEQWNTENVWLNGFALSENIDATLDIWTAAVRSPVVDAAALDRLRSRSIAALPQALASPGSLASLVLALSSYGPTHPFSRRPSVASYGAVAVDDCAQFVAEVIRPRGSLLQVAGDITRAQVEEKFGPRLNLGSPPAAPAPVLPDAMPDPATLVFADVPGASQTIIYLWGPGPARQAPDFMAASVMVEIFGGDALASRLGLDLREMMGSTYSVSGGISDWKTGGRLTINVPVQTDKTQAALAAIVADAQRMRDTEVTDVELARARDGRIAGLPGRFATVAGALGQFSDLLYFGLPLDYYQGYPGLVAQVDRAAVTAAARRYLAADQLHFVVVGDGKTVRPMLDALIAPGAALAGGTVKVVGPDGR